MLDPISETKIEEVSPGEVLARMRGFSVSQWSKLAGIWVVLFAVEYVLYLFVENEGASVVSSSNGGRNPLTYGEWLIDVAGGVFEFLINFVELSFLLAMTLLAQLVVSVIRIGLLRKTVGTPADIASTSWLDLSAISVLMVIPFTALSCFLWWMANLVFGVTLVGGLLFVPVLLALLAASRGASFRNALRWPLRALARNPVTAGLASLLMLLWLAPVPVAFFLSDLGHALFATDPPSDMAARLQTTTSLLPLAAILGFFAWVYTGTATRAMETMETHEFDLPGGV